MRRGLALVDSVDGLEGHANLIVLTRLGGSSDLGADAGFGVTSAGFASSLGPHANMMHLFLPRTASMFCSVF